MKSCYRRLVDDFSHLADLKWTRMWSFHNPTKVKNFFWQVCSHCLPTADILAVKRVSCPRICQLCLQEDETLLHQFVNCKIAKECWRLVNGDIISGNYLTFLDWCNMVFEKFDEEVSCLVIMICWNLWNARNSKSWNNLSFSKQSIIERGKTYLKDWRSAMNRDSMHSRQNSTTHRLEKPQHGWLKMNVDAAIDISRGRMGFEWILRDRQGAFIAEKRKAWRGTFEPKVAEAMAIGEALSWLKEAGQNYVQVESDSLQVIQNLKSDAKISYFDLITHDVKDIMSCFSHLSFSFVRRSANQAAHMIARESVSRTSCMEWFSNPPLFLRDVLALDLN